MTIIKHKHCKCKGTVGFKRAFKYVLDLLCYAYYVKGDNLVDDICFDQLEKIWMQLFKKESAPMRGMGREEGYGPGIETVYNEIKKLRELKNGH